MTTKKVYCANCDNEAEWMIADSNTPLCEACHTVYEWGQNNPSGDLIPIEEWDEKGDNNEP